jgi:nucleotide-binding universal stress UspA family protein
MELQTATTPQPIGDSVPRPRVVVGADDSPGARAAIEYAFAAAGRRRAALDVVHAYPVNLPWEVDTRLDGPDVDAVREGLARGCEDLRSAAHGEVPAAAEVPVRVLIGRGSAASVLIEESERADLLVVGSRGRGGVRSALLGSVALHCVTAAHCPVVVIHEATDDDGAGNGTAAAQAPRVVVGMDGSPESRAALAAALGEAAAMGAVVDAVAVYSLTDHRGQSWPSRDDLAGQVRDRLNATIEAVRAGMPADVLAGVLGVRPVVLEGQPTDLLLQQAHGAQLLVVGSHGHGVLRGLVLGSVALGCVLHGRCPVMVVHGVPVADTAAVPLAETASV